MMDDLISRQTAVDAFDGVKVNEENCTEYDIGYNDGIDFAVSRLSVLPSVQETKLAEWCTDCKEHDQERHCCPRWNRVIRNTVEELKAEHRWIPVTERLPEDDEDVIVSCTDDSGDTPFSYTTVAWHFKGTWVCNDERCFFITAWMPLPEPWKGGRR